MVTRTGLRLADLPKIQSEEGEARPGPANEMSEALGATSVAARAAVEIGDGREREERFTWGVDLELKVMSGRLAVQVHEVVLGGDGILNDTTPQSRECEDAREVRPPPAREGGSAETGLTGFPVEPMPNLRAGSGDDTTAGDQHAVPDRARAGQRGICSNAGVDGFAGDASVDAPDEMSLTAGRGALATIEGGGDGLGRCLRRHRRGTRSRRRRERSRAPTTRTGSRRAASA